MLLGVCASAALPADAAAAAAGAAAEARCRQANTYGGLGGTTGMKARLFWLFCVCCMQQSLLARQQAVAASVQRSSTCNSLVVKLW